MNKAVPVTLITGFLGSGKTTLLNRLLNRGLLKDAALIINEFGDVGIDHLLVETADEGIIELSDGCLCCTIRGDLIDTLARILDRKSPGKLTRIVIESTGLADPVPILQAVIGHPVLSDRLQFDGVITLVDAVNGMATLDAHEEAVKQVAIADLLVVTKTDLPGAHEQLLGRLGNLNPAAQILDAQADDFDVSDILESAQSGGEARDANVIGRLKANHEEHDHAHHHDKNRHDANIRAFTLISEKGTDRRALSSFINLLRSAHGPKLLRVKGIVGMKETPEHPVVIHGVQQVFHPPVELNSWPSEDRRTRLVIIGKGLPETFVRKLFDAFMGEVGVDTPDRLALEDNPLVVPGYSGSF